MVDDAVPAEHSVKIKEKKNMERYMDLARDIYRNWRA